MIKIRCVVERITYQNQENGYSVMKVKVKGYSDLVTLVGNLLDVPVGAVLLCNGDWKMDKRYGQQFACETWEEVMPATVYRIEKYLGSGLVKGIGPKFAHLIVERFGTETIEVIEDDIERLYEVAGIGKKRVEKIRDSWEKQGHQERDDLPAAVWREHCLRRQDLPTVWQGKHRQREGESLPSCR